MQKPNWKRTLGSLAGAIALTGLSNALPIALPLAMAQDGSRAVTLPAGLQDPAAFQSTPIQYLPFAHFAIPFDIDRSGRLPQEVHLWVSADQGKSWLKYASNSPDKRSFEFQAAAEGEYLFAVQTQDDRGMSALAAAPPMRILVDTTKPQVELKADINAAGRLVIDYRVEDRFLSEDSVRLSYTIDGRAQWEEIRVGRMKRDGNTWSGQIEQEMPRCHELELKLVASDLAQNSAETTARYHAPRTAAAGSGMQLASQRAQSKPIALGQRDDITPDLPAPSVTPTPTGPRAIANRISQLAGSAPPVAKKPVASIADQTSGDAMPTARATTAAATQTALDALAALGLESTKGAVAWEPSSSRKSKPSATSVPIKSESSLGRTVSANSEGPDSGSLIVSNEPSNSITSALPDNASEVSNFGAGQAPTIPQVPYEELPRPGAIEDSIPVFQRTEQKPTVAASGATPSNSNLAPDSQSSLELSIDAAQPAPTSSSALNSVLQRAQAPVAAILNKLPPTVEPNVGPQSAIQVENAQPSTGLEGTTATRDSAKSATSPSANEGLPTIDNDAYHSRSRSFSLDYSIESLRGLAVADIELWGTDDRGNTWQKWGSDPDRESPFDVQVGADGLYGFRMVIIGQNGLVSNRPNDGDPADMWINVDTKIPSVKITRALYGEGPDAGMLVIDYSCDDENLHDRPISLAYSDRPTGPWSTIVTGLRNTGIYLWKADPNLPQQVYLRIQAVDRAGNVQEHRLDLPINLRGLTPRGRIQGFRPIDPK